MMYAIVDIKGFQFRAEKNAVLRVPLLNTAEPGQALEFDRVLLVRKDDEVVVGTPVVEGAAIVAEVIDHGKGKKKVIYHHKRRKGYRKLNGYRHQFTEVTIKNVIA